MLVAECGKYFAGLWGRAGDELTKSKLDEMERVISNARKTGVNVASTALGDGGHDAGFTPPSVVSPAGFVLGPEGCVKFSGIGSDRRDPSFPTRAELDRSGMHWACSYSAWGRPRQLKEGDTMFLSVLTKLPNDIVIYGRATVLREHDEVEDVVSAADIKHRSWKKKWPYYIRVHRGEFLAGTLANGVSLNELIETFGAFSFAPTEKRFLKGQKDADPRSALKQKPAIHLTQRAKSWLNGRLEAVFAKHGNLTQADLATLDWP